MQIIYEDSLVKMNDFIVLIQEISNDKGKTIDHFILNSYKEKVYKVN